MREIGSEYHYCEIESGKGIKIPKGFKDSCFSFTGRTAIETVIRNELIHKVLIPSYCCDSMIEPFREAGIQICFYDVNYNECFDVQLNIPENVDCLLWCNYFGFSMDMPMLTDFISRGGIVIEDITHSFFSKRQYNLQSHYIVASLRKWVAILCGGYCATTIGKLNVKPTNTPSDVFLELRKSAMMLKTDYLENGNISKAEFLNKYSESNRWLGDNYSDYTIDKFSMDYLLHLDLERVRDIRRTNAKVLYEGFNGMHIIRPLFKVTDMDCPLFVPVVVLNGKRDLVRQKLIENNIYCPVHWPHPKENCESNLYEIELSLVCDQRYNEDDMQRVVSVLHAIDREGNKNV